MRRRKEEGAMLIASCWGRWPNSWRRGPQLFLVSVNNALDEWMADNIRPTQADFLAARDAGKPFHRINQAASAIGWQIDLGGVP